MQTGLSAIIPPLRLVCVALLALAGASGCSGSDPAPAGAPPPAAPPPPNAAPVAAAGADQTVSPGATVTLNGIASSDIDGSIVAFAWAQTQGSTVTLQTPVSAQTTFTAPPVTSPAVLEFRLTVTDDDGATASDLVAVTVNPAVTAPSVLASNNYTSALSIAGLDVIPRGVAIGSDGRVFTVGSFGAGAPISAGGASTSSGDSQDDLFFLVQNPDGSVRRLDAFGGGGGPDFGTDIAIDADGSVFLIGGFAGAASIRGLAVSTGSPANVDAFIAKLTEDGAAEWIISGRGTGFDFANEIEIAANGDLVVTGSFQGAIDFGGGVTLSSPQGPGISQAFLLRATPTGQPLWARAVTGPVEIGGRGVDSEPANIDGDSTGRRVFLAAQFNGGSATVAAPGGGVTVTGPGGGGDCLVAAFGEAGDLLFARSFGGPGEDNCRGVGATIDGEIAVAGEFTGPASFGPSTLTSNGQEDIYVVRLDPAGDVLSALSAGGAGDDGGPEIEVDPNGVAFFTGSFAGAATVSVGGGFNSGGAPREVFIAETPRMGDSVVFADASPGSGDDVAFALAAGPNNAFALVGTYTGTLQFGATTLSTTGAPAAFVAINGPGGAPPPSQSGAIISSSASFSQTRYAASGALRSVTVPVFLYAPANAPANYPLIVWSHGGLASPQNVELVEFWVSQGYIVAAPAHADSSEQRNSGGSAGLAGTSDSFSFVNRAADVSMVLDRVVDLEAFLPPGYAIDETRAAVAGHSFGALTAMEILGADWTLSPNTSNDAFSASVIADGTVPDERFDAGIFVSPAGNEQGYGLTNFNNVDRPFVALTGTRDSGPPPPNEFPSGFRDRYDVFSSSENDGIGADDGVNDRGQYLVVLDNATHFDYLGNNNRYDPIVRDFTTRFWDGFLGGDSAALAPLNDPAAFVTANPDVFEYFVRP